MDCVSAYVQRPGSRAAHLGSLSPCASFNACTASASILPKSLPMASSIGQPPPFCFKRPATKTSGPCSQSFCSRRTSRSSQALHSDKAVRLPCLADTHALRRSSCAAAVLAKWVEQHGRLEPGWMQVSCRFGVVLDTPPRMKNFRSCVALRSERERE